MVNAALTWQQAAVVAAALVLAAMAMRRAPQRVLRTLSPFAREAGIIAALYSLWQFAGSALIVSTDGAYARGEAILRWERAWHLPSEHTVQDWILPHPRLAQACNWYYAVMHFGALFVFLLWLFARHRPQYKPVRNTIVLVTAACLLIQMVPVAPPRLIAGAGFVDTAEHYGQSVYSALSFVGPDQLAAMPSVHVAWAVLIPIAVVRISPSPWRWLAILHAVLTIFVVTATANHYWADGIVAVALLALAMLLQHYGAALWARVRSTEPLPAELAPEPVVAALD